MARFLPVLLFLASLVAVPGPVRAQEPARKRAPVTDRANLGVQLQPVRPAGKDEGARISYVYPESAAQAMGLRTGDEVLEMNGMQVPDRKFLTTELGKENIGAKVSFRIRRGGEVLEMRGPMGSYQKTRKAFLDLCRKELVGKPFSTSAELFWPDGVDGLQALRGRIGVVVSFDNCQDCVLRKWGKVRELSERYSRVPDGEKYLGFAGIYSSTVQPHAANLEARAKVLSSYPSRAPVAVARYPGDQVPPGSVARDALVQDHGLALLDPEGKLLHLELVNLDLESPDGGFARALQEAWTRWGPREAKEAPKDKVPAPGAGKS